MTEIQESEYVVVTDPQTGELSELPTNLEDGNLSLLTLEHTFPGAHGLKFKNPTTGVSRALLLDKTGSNFLPPAGGWSGKIFSIVMRPLTNDGVDGKKRKRAVESENDSGEVSSDNEDDGGEKSKKKAKRSFVSEDQAICSDLIVLGLPYSIGKDEFKKYFEHYGPVTMCEIKEDTKGNSRGFGFIQMERYEDQIRILSKPNHLIGGRKCQVRMPSSKSGDGAEANLSMNPKLYVSHVPEKATTESLNKYFSEHAHKIDSKCSVLDVYIPKPFRGFGFVTFSSPAVARELIRQKEFIFDGVSMYVTAAAPRDSLPKTRVHSYSAIYSTPRAGFNNFPRPMFHFESGRVGPRNGPVSGWTNTHGNRFFDNGSMPGRSDWIEPIQNNGLSSRYYDDRNRHSHFSQERNLQNVVSGKDNATELVTAAFKAFLAAAQQRNSRNNDFTGDDLLNTNTFGDSNNNGAQQWR